MHHKAKSVWYPDIIFLNSLQMVLQMVLYNMQMKTIPNRRCPPCYMIKCGGID